MTETIYDAWGIAHVLPGLYDDFPQFYRLAHYGVSGAVISELVIRQPVGWDKLRLILKRDETWHGVNYEYTDERTVCEFDGYSGRDWIETIFRAEGEDAVITIQTGVKVDANTFVVEYEGRLNLSTYKRIKRRITCGLERKSLHSRLLAKWDTAYEMSGYLQTPLVSQTLTESFSNVVNSSKKTELTFPGDTNGHVWVQFDTSNPQTAEIEEFAAGKPMGISDSEGPEANDEWLFKFRSEGVFSVDIVLDYRLWWAVKKRTISVGAARVTNYRLVTQLVHVQADGTRKEYPIHAPKVANAGTSEVSVYATGELKTQLAVKKGDKLFLYGKLQFSHNKNELQQTQVQLTSLTTRISLTGQTKNAPTAGASVTVWDAINAGIAAAAGVFERLRSAYYGLAGSVYPVSGPGAERLLIDGLSIRGFKKKMSLTLRDILLSLQAIDGIGLSYGNESDVLGVRDTVEIKAVEDYYRPVELLRLDHVADYKEEVLENELYSSVDIGFDKWVEEGSNALEEVHTTHQLSTPIREERNKKTLVSTLVASTLAIERTRREQFADKPKDGTTYDNDIFIIQGKPTPSYAGPIKFYKGAFHDIVEVSEVIPWLTPGMIITPFGTVSNNFQYTVTFVSDATRSPWTFYVEGGSAFTEEVVANGQLKASSLSPLLPETGADLASVAGLASAKTAYNLRLTPGRMLYRNIALWGGCLVDKGLALINKTKLPQNGNLVTVIEGEDPLRVTERNQVAVDEILPRLLFRPRRISCSVRLSRSQIQRLRLGLTGLLPLENSPAGVPTDRNYGYVSLLDDTGVRVAGYVLSATWGSGDENSVLQLKQTALDLNDTTSGLDCSQFLGWTLDQAERADATTRRRIELCRFIDVDIP